MRIVFADTLYWVAVINRDDPWHGPSLGARRALGDARLVTTDGVLVEVLAALGRGRWLRESAASMVRSILGDPSVTVVAQCRASRCSTG